jgi:hypothetical protein
MFGVPGKKKGIADNAISWRPLREDRYEALLFCLFVEPRHRHHIGSITAGAMQDEHERNTPRRRGYEIGQGDEIMPILAVVNKGNTIRLRPGRRRSRRNAETRRDKGQGDPPE